MSNFGARGSPYWFKCENSALDKLRHQQNIRKEKSKSLHDCEVKPKFSVSKLHKLDDKSGLCAIIVTTTAVFP